MKKLIILTIVALYADILNAQWYQTTQNSESISCLVGSGSSIFAGAYGNVFLSTNNGGLWTAVNMGLQNRYINSLVISGTNIFAGTDSGGVFLSTNNGGLWTPANIGLTNHPVYTFAISGTNIFAGTVGGGVFLSTNSGGLWTAINNGLTNLDVYSLVLNGTNIFAATNAGVFLSTNNGGLWTAVNNGLTSLIMSSLAISVSNIFAGTFGGGIFLSTSNGNTWTAINNGLPSNTSVRSFALNGTNIFAETYHDGVFLSTNNGGLWTAINAGLPGADLFSLGINATNIFATVNLGSGNPDYIIYTRPLSELTGIEEKNSNSHFALYPNPTTGKLRVESAELKVKSLEVYNVLGEKVFQSSNLNQQTSIEIDLSPSAKGIYFLKIYDGKKIYDKKIVVQ
ncbi:MAG: T9SS type A sorting domain-containing protein [Bacteroidota bacterium]